MLPARGVGLSLSACLLGATASAQNPIVFNRTGSGARAAGMANAFIAVSDDGSAASWNPAGLAQLRKPELSVVSTTSRQSLSTEGFRTRDDLSSFTGAGSTYQSTYLDFASLAVPVTLWGKPVTFQGAWRRQYTLDYREVVSTFRVPNTPEAPPPARIDANHDLVGSVDIASLAAAVKVTPRLALGGSFNIWRGDWNEDDAFTETPQSGPGLPEFLVGHNSSHVRGQNVSLGLMLTYPKWSAGLLYQFPLSSDFKSQGDQTMSGAPPPPSRAIDGTLRFPRAVGVGAAWRPATRWTVALDFTWDEWTEAVIETPTTPPVSLFDGLPKQLSATRDTLSVNAGAEHLFSGDGFVVPLRFGAAWEPQGYRNPYTRDPVNFVMLAAGAGYNTNSLKFDAALQYRWAHFRDGANFGASVPPPGPLPSAVGERDQSEWRLKLSLILRLGDTDKLRRIVRRVFGSG
jgi:long-subunit fatty acid transport protein